MDFLWDILECLWTWIGLVPLLSEVDCEIQEYVHGGQPDQVTVSENWTKVCQLGD